MGPYRVFVLTKQDGYCPEGISIRARMTTRIFFAEGLEEEDLWELRRDPQVKEVDLAMWFNPKDEGD